MKKAIDIDDVYRLVAGHSIYSGNDILSAFTCLSEGKDVKPIKPLDIGYEPYREETCERKHHCNDYVYWHCLGCNGSKNCYNCDLYEDAMDNYCQYAGECVPIQNCKYFVKKKGVQK